MKPDVPSDTGGRLARIERMIAQHRLAKVRRLQRKAIRLWRQLEAEYARFEFEKPTERVH